MNRVVILGPGGAGKSALAVDISRRTGLPVIHLDRIFWREGWSRAPADDAAREFGAAVAGDRWILDGNFLWDDRVADDERFDRADTVIFLDLPRRTCLWRVLWRLVRDGRRRRPDLPEGCNEGFDLDLLVWIWSYPTTDRPRVREVLGRLPETVAVHQLRSRQAVRKFIEAL